MPQGDMSFDTFKKILDTHIQRYGVPQIVSLQGEGEPTLHANFFRMAEYIHQVGAQPYTITNGSYKYPERFLGIFSQIGVSIDSLDEAAAREIGRYNLGRVIEFIGTLAPKVKISVHSVFDRVHTPLIAGWCRERGYAHVVQPLQTKADYVRRYPDRVTGDVSAGRFSCGYLRKAEMRYYNLSGQEMPCCYIKDASAFEGIRSLSTHQQEGTWPECCRGCRFGSSPP